MLKLKNITKIYRTGGEEVKALKGIDLSFRKSEFVSVLGPSGCGKTTLLNIIGGLDQYTSGDLLINGISTKSFNDRDWDTYRNHSIGFIFQSYNLIPHQTVLQNVELALTLSGISKSERRKRAKEALCKVGLDNQLNKKPSEMSGGQVQRVAIARAIVNNPDIILADEPTGALDTKTSLQVMNILKEISKDRLVIMVTHNPDLAEEYSTRVISILDGEITNDTNPITKEETPPVAKPKHKRKKKKSSLKLSTSFGLSLKNLITKKGRTILTSFAGSIGIIGIALVFAVSQGATNYITSVQEDTLASYPLTLEAQHTDMSAMLELYTDKAKSDEAHENDAVYQKNTVYDLIKSLDTAEAKENDLKSFKTYLENEMKNEDSTSGLNKAVTGVQYTYDFDLQVYSKNSDGEITTSNTQELLKDILLKYADTDLSSLYSLSEQSKSTTTSNMMSSATSLWQEILPGNDGEAINPIIKKQYDVVYGKWPEKYNEVLLVLDENNEINDLSLYALGLKTEDDIKATVDAAKNNDTVTDETKQWSYEDICNIDFKTILNSDCYKYNKKKNTYTDLRDTSAGLKYLYNNALKLKVCGIVKPNENSSSEMLDNSIAYTNKLTNYIVKHSEKSTAVKEQLKDKNTDVLTGLPFEDSSDSLSNAQKAKHFKKYIKSLNDTQKAEAYIKIASIPSDEEINTVVDKALDGLSRDDIESQMIKSISTQMNVSKNDAEDYLQAMSDKEVKDLFKEAIEEQYKTQYASQAKAKLANVDTASLVAMLDSKIDSYTNKQCANYYDNTLTFSDATYEDNLSDLGYADLDNPSTINLYTSSFENKDTIVDAIDNYNNTVDDLSEISYTDYVGLIMSSVTTIINAITYILIAFIAVSLIVSSIMIGVITLISVQERTKEIGILRAMGASKKNISTMFNAETAIIGFASGTIGILITYLLCIPINIILRAVTDIQTLGTQLPLPVAITLIIISVVLTLTAGIIPSRSAAKKDPVVALRTE